MAFKIGDNAVNKNITLEQLTAGLDPKKDQKKIARITQIFEKYNTNKDGGSVKSLDMDEQVALMNDIHQLDIKDGETDGKISRKDIRKAGLAGEYRAYRDFIEAYQNAVSDDVSSYELTFKDDTLDGKPYVKTIASRNDTIEGQPFTEEHSYDNVYGKYETSYSTTDTSVSLNPQGQVTRQVSGETTVLYRAYASGAKNARPGIIRVTNGENSQTLKLQADGTYLDETDNMLYQLNAKGIPEKYTPPEPVVEEEPLVAETVEKQARPTAKKYIKMTQGWKNQRMHLEAETIEKFNSMSKASEVLTELVAMNENYKYTDFNEQLLSDLVKNNPSVFDENGIIYSDARWDRLDFPVNLAKYITE